MVKISPVKNIGTGAGEVFKQETASNENELRTVKAGTGISVTNNTSDITVANADPENTSVANVGTGAGQVYRDMTGDQINLKTIKAGSGIGVTNNADDVTVANTDPENTSVANVGTGAGQSYRDMTGDQINLKTIKAGSGIGVTNNADDVTIAATSAALLGVSDIPVLDDVFTDAAVKPFWTNSQMLTSADWQFSAANDRLEGIAQNNTYDWYRQGIEGDADHRFKFSINSATSCGMWFVGNSIEIFVKYAPGTPKVYMGCTGESDIDVALSLSDPFWLRIVRIADDFYGYYKQNDGDPWILIGTFSNKNLGHDMTAALDSANTAYIHSAILYDNSFNGSATKAKFVKTIPLTDAATIAIDASLGNLFTVTLGGNRTLGAPTNAKAGQMIIVRVKQDGTGSRTLAYNAIYRFSTDIPSPTLTTTASKTDYIGFIYNEADTKWDCIGKVFGF